MCFTSGCHGKALAHPKSVAYTCAHLLIFLDSILASIMSKTQNVLGNDDKDFYHLF